MTLEPKCPICGQAGQHYTWCDRFNYSNSVGIPDQLIGNPDWASYESTLMRPLVEAGILSEEAFFIMFPKARPEK